MADVKEFERNKPHVNIGTIGHVDHGKTTLTSAITTVLQRRVWQLQRNTKILIMLLRKARGVTINISHQEYETEKRHYAHIDAPATQII